MKSCDSQKSLIKSKKTETVLLNTQVYNTLNTQLFLKCDYQNHPTIAGNKFWKLKYNLQAAHQQGKSILTFGGAHSNHIYATAAAGAATQIPTIGIIRGDTSATLTPTLAFAQAQSMKLHPVSRTDYRRRYDPDFLAQLQAQYPDALIIPEGGSNAAAIRGCTELLSPTDYLQYDYIACACGTGGTIAGLAAAAPAGIQLLGFPALKGAQFLEKDVTALQQSAGFTPRDNITWVHDYHFGGYAKHRPELINFINAFRAQHGIPLDPIYTGKLLYGLTDLLTKGYFPAGSRILAIHSGGLQGISGFNTRYGALLDV